MKSEPDLTIPQVAELTNQSIDIVRQLVAEGRFPNAYRAGTGKPKSPIRIPHKDLTHYKQTQPLAYTA